MMRQLSTVVTVLLFAVWVVTLRPIFLGGPASYIIVSGHSMEPTFYTGDLAILQRQNTYQTGDIVAYRPNSTQDRFVIHRIVGGSAASGFIVRGDNNSWDDPWYPKPADILGKVWIHWPGAGNVLDRLRQPQYFSTVAAAVATFLIFGGGKATQRRGRRSRKRERHMALSGTMANARRRAGGTAWTIALASVAGLLGLGFLAGAVYSFRQPAEQAQKVSRLSYVNMAAFTYTIHMQPTALYPDGVIGPITPPTSPGTEISSPAPIPTKVVRTLDLGFTYQLQSGDNADVAGDMSATLRIQADKSWTKTLALVVPTPFSGTDVSLQIPVDLAQVIALIHRIEQETDLTAVTYTLAVVPTVHLKGQLGSQSLDETYAPAFTMQFQGAQIIPDANLSRTDVKQIGSTLMRPRMASLLGFSIPLAVARMGSALGALLALAVLGLLLFKLSRDDALLIRARYGSKMVDVTGHEAPAGVRVVHIGSIRDLELLAQRDGGIIFHERLGHAGDQYFVEDERTLYSYTPARRGKGA